MFKYAISNWPAVMSVIKFAMEAREGFKPRYYAHPSISTMLSFYQAGLHAYIQHLQMDQKYVKPPEGLEILISPASWKFLDATDPCNGHPGWTDQMEATHMKLEKAESLVTSNGDMAQALKQWKHLKLETMGPEEAVDALASAAAEYSAELEGEEAT